MYLSLSDIAFNIISSKSMLLQVANFHSLLWLSSIPLFVEIHTHTPHIFFIHSSVDGQLGCLRILAVVYNAPVNIEVHGCF